MSLELWQKMKRSNYFGTIKICHNSKSTNECRWVIDDVYVTTNYVDKNMRCPKTNILWQIYCHKNG